MTEAECRYADRRGGCSLARALGRWLVAAAAMLSVRGGTTSIAAQESAPLPRPPGVSLMTLPREPGNRPHETSIAVNPRDPRHVIVSYQDPSSATTAGRWLPHVAWTADGGESWTVAPATAPPTYHHGADPAVTIDLHGHAFLTYAAVDNRDPAWKDKARNGMFVRRSLDGGRTWEQVHVPVLEHATRRVAGHIPYLAADNHASSSHAGNLYLGWHTNGQILFSRSTDDGKTWSPPLVISTDSASGPFRATIGRDGTVYAIWADGSPPLGTTPRPHGAARGIVLAISRDGGRTFTPARRILSTWMVADVAGFRWAYDFPSIAIDPRTSPGRLFVAWGDSRHGDIDILASTSEDGGRTWTPPVRVNDDPKQNGKDQVNTWLTVDPADGAVYVMFYDRRGDRRNVLTTVTLARSTDGGRTFTNYAWNGTPSDPRRARHGDYVGVAAMNGRVYGAWIENATDAVPTSGTAASSADLPPELGPSVIRIGIADFRSPPRRAATNAGRR